MVIRKEYEAQVEVQHLAQQGTHYSDEDSALFQETKAGRNYSTGCNQLAELDPRTEEIQW